MWRAHSCARRLHEATTASTARPETRLSNGLRCQTIAPTQLPTSPPLSPSPPPSLGPSQTPSPVTSTCHPQTARTRNRPIVRRSSRPQWDKFRRLNHPIPHLLRSLDLRINGIRHTHKHNLPWLQQPPNRLQIPSSARARPVITKPLPTLVGLSDLLCRMGGIGHGFPEMRQVNFLEEPGFALWRAEFPSSNDLDWARFTFELEGYLEEVRRLVRQLYRPA